MGNSSTNFNLKLRHVSENLKGSKINHTEKMSLLFNETHTHIYIYIYMFVCVCVYFLCVPAYINPFGCIISCGNI